MALLPLLHQMAAGDATDENEGNQVAISYLPVENFPGAMASGADSFVVTVTDGEYEDAITVSVTVVTNDLPTLKNELDDHVAFAQSPFSTSVLQVPFESGLNAPTFLDEEDGLFLTLTAQQTNGAALPAWLSFDAATGGFSGTPANEDRGTVISGSQQPTGRCDHFG